MRIQKEFEDRFGWGLSPEMVEFLEKVIADEKLEAYADGVDFGRSMAEQVAKGAPKILT